MSLNKMTGCFSRVQIADFFPIGLRKPVNLISITDPASPPPEINGEWDDVLCLSFWDITMSPHVIHNVAIEPATDEQIQEIYDFILLHKSDHIYVHCEAGISRSGAIVEFLDRQGWLIDPRTTRHRVPNIHVLNKLSRLALASIGTDKCISPFR